MNDTKIEWATKTWNPVTGCNRGCHYCYAKGIARRFGGHIGKSKISNPIKDIPLHDLTHSLLAVRKSGKIVTSPFPFGFEPTFHRYRLDEPLREKKPQNIFVSSMGDLFGPWIPDEWIQAVFNACKQAPQHRYLFLTKFPERYIALANAGKLPLWDECPNFWYGTTITKAGDVFFGAALTYNTFLSIEPISGDLGLEVFRGVRWVIVGAETGNRKGKITPERAWIENIIKAAARCRAAVLLKDSLIPIMGEENMKRDFPWE